MVHRTARGAWLNLEWVRRDRNVEADELTNEDFGRFKKERRIAVTWDVNDYPVIKKLAAAGAELFAEVQGRRLGPARRRKKKKAKKRKPLYF